NDDNVGPYGLEQLLFGERFAGVLGQAQQDFHYLGLEANGPAFGRHVVEGRIDDPAPHFEALLHEPPRGGDRASKYTAYKGWPHENSTAISGADAHGSARGRVSLRRARSRLGGRRYHLLRNNCEHFCNWWQLGLIVILRIGTLRRMQTIPVRFS